MASKTFDSLLSKAGFSTYEELATSLGISRHTLWRWRSGSPPRRKSTLVVLVARALKTTPPALLKILAA